MDLTIDQASLARALRLAARVAPARSPLPILQHALLVAGPGRLTVTACDHDLAVLATLAAALLAAAAATSLASARQALRHDAVSAVKDDW